MNRKLKLKIVELYGTQADFSMAVEEDESTISRVIRGRRKLTPETEKKMGGCTLYGFCVL